MFKVNTNSIKFYLSKQYLSYNFYLHLTYIILDVLSSVEDFDSSDEIYEAVGEILHEVGRDRSEDDIRLLCTKFFSILKPESDKINSKNRKLLDAPVHLGAMTANLDSEIAEMTSLWMQQRNDTLVSKVSDQKAFSFLRLFLLRYLSKKVDKKQLEKAEAKLQQKQERRDGVKPSGPSVPVLQSASASQVLSKKDAKVDAKGQSRSMDIRIENFDISFGDRVLLTGADLLLAGGRRYGLVGRNGLGKTTLLRMISEKQLQIPSHISILHVEQEVVGDETLAIASVLECDEKLNELWRREKELIKDPSKSEVSSFELHNKIILD